MSEVKGVSGTQSPPLESTGEDRPMGASSVEQSQHQTGGVDAVSDSEQRGAYFQEFQQGQTAAGSQKASKEKTD